MSKDVKIYTKNEISKAENPALSAAQMDFLLKNTPEKYLKQRPAKGGGQWTYVSSAYIEKVLNLMFGFNWSFEVKEFNIQERAKQAIVLGRLTCHAANGAVIIKEQFGRADIKYKKGTDEALDIGNDLKAAASDALKKCASKIGIASDVYGGGDMSPIQVVENEDEREAIIAERVAKFVNTCNTIAELEALPNEAKNYEVWKIKYNKLKAQE